MLLNRFKFVCIHGRKFNLQPTSDQNPLASTHPAAAAATAGRTIQDESVNQIYSGLR